MTFHLVEYPEFPAIISFYRGIETLNDVIAVYSGPWYWVNAKGDHELEDARKLRAEGFEAYVPTDIRQARRKHHSPNRLSFDHPLIPRLVFARGPSTLEVMFPVVRYLDGTPFLIPDNQLQAFRVRIKAWHDLAKAMVKEGKKDVQGKGKMVTVERENLKEEWEARCRARQTLDEAA